MARKMVVSFNCKGVEFHVCKKSYHKIETKNNTVLIYLDIKISNLFAKRKF